MNVLSRRQLLKYMGVTAAAGALAACTTVPPATQSAASSGAAAESAAPGAAAKTVSYWGHAYDGRVKVVDTVLADWTEEFPEIQIDHQTLPDLWEKIAASFAAGTQPDLFTIDNGVLPRYASSNLLAPIDPSAWGKGSEAEIVELFEPATVDYLTYDGHLWGPPMEVSVHSPAFRLDHFAEYGIDPNSPPDTWEDWAEVGKQGVKRDDNGVLQRQWMEWYGPSHYSVLMGPILAGLGGWWHNAEGTEGTLNTPEGLQTLQFVYDTVHTWGLNDPGFASPDDAGHFVAGRETYAWHNFPGARWVSTTFDNMEYGTDWKLQPMFKWAQGDRKNIGYAYGFFVTQASQNQPEAWKFVEYATRYPERTSQWIEMAGLVQTYKDWTSLEVVQDLPFVDHFNQEFEWSVPNVLHPKVNEVFNEVNRAIGRIVSTPPESPEVVAADYDAAVTAILNS